MAKKFGFTAEISADYSALNEALKDINSASQKLNSELREINRELKLDPNNVTLAAQKMDVMKQSAEQAEKKLAELKKQQEAMNAALEAGKISDSYYREYQREIVSAESALKKLTEEQKNLGKATEETTQKAVTLEDIIKANVISDVIVKGAEKVTGALKEISSEAINAYSQYEQLVGGVETLFSGSEEVVLKNAQNAFKTAGLSANDYMETVTSFAATLLQGLEGDTQKAAEIADQAIIDMADNANKMGTDMSSVQSAYQGFAKQNYSLLDNLKLGYGGTQAEMARLINDSGVLNGQIVATANNVKDIPFDKMIEAIHVIQTNLGITGTTAREAETTIEGSLNKLKASWENALVEIAQPLDDFAQGGLTVLNDNVDEIKEALVDTMEEIKPLLDEGLEKAKNWIESGGLKEFSEDVVGTVEFIIDNKETLLGIFAALELSLGAERMSKVIDGSKEIISAINGIGDAANTAVGGVDAMSMSLSGWVAVAAVTITTAMALKTAIDNAADRLGEHSEEVNALDDEYKKLNETLEEYNRLKAESIELAAQEAGQNIEDAKARAQSYKSQIDTLESLIAKNREYYGTNDLRGNELYYFDQSGNAVGNAGSFDEISDQLGSLYSDYYAANDIVREYSETIDEATDNSVKHMGEVSEAAANSVKSGEEALASAWEHIRATTKAKMDELDDQLATHKIDDTQYWAQRKAYLEAHQDKESEEWWKYYDKVTEHYDKLAETEKKAREQAEKKQKEEKKTQTSEAKKDFDDLLKQLTDEEITREEFNKKYEEMTADLAQKEIDISKYASDKIADYDRKIRKENMTAWEKSSKEISDKITKNYENVTKAYEAARKKIISSAKLIDETVTDTSGNKRYILSDFEKQRKELKKYREDLEKLRKTGISDDLMEQVMSLSYDSGERQGYISELLKMGESQRKKYYKDVDAYLAEASEAAKGEVADDLAEADKQAKEGIEKIYGDMPENAYEKGVETAQAYIDGINKTMASAGSLRTMTADYTASSQTAAAVAASSGAAGSQGAQAAGTAAVSYGGTNLYSGNMQITINVAGKQAIKCTLDELIRKGKLADAR